MTISTVRCILEYKLSKLSEKLIHTGVYHEGQGEITDMIVKLKTYVDEREVK